MTKIDKRAEVHPTAEIGTNVEIGPWTYIEEGVIIGDNTWIAPHAVIRRGTQIGKNNRIHQFTTLGDDPQHLAHKGEGTRLEIGDDNVIREYASIHRGTENSNTDGLTRLGNKNYMMAYSHIGHDCIVKNEVMMVNHSALAGHVEVRDFATIGAYCAVHQFVTVGEYCFIAQSCLVGQNLVPYTMVAGHTAMARVYGLNLVGLRRRGFAKDTIRQLQQAYKIIYNVAIPLKEVIGKLQELVPACPQVQLMIDLIEESAKGRGFLRKNREKGESDDDVIV